MYGSLRLNQVLFLLFDNLSILKTFHDNCICHALFYIVYVCQQYRCNYVTISIKTMFGPSLPPVVYRRAHVLFMLNNAWQIQLSWNVFNIDKLSNRRNKTWFNSNFNYWRLHRSLSMHFYICITICLRLVYMRTWDNSKILLFNMIANYHTL
jgi:hypothetical protein